MSDGSLSPEVEESVWYYVRAFEFMCRRCPTGQVSDLYVGQPPTETYWQSQRWPVPQITVLHPLVVAAWTNAQWVGTNMSFLVQPVQGEAELRRAIKAAVDFAAIPPRRHRRWYFTFCREYLPQELLNELPRIFGDYGMVPFEPRGGPAAASPAPYGVVVDHLLPSSVPLPEMTFRRIGDRETRRSFCDLTASAYGIPPNWVFEVFDDEDQWTNPAFGYLGYVLVENQLIPVTSAEAIVLGDRIYCANVATLEAFRRRGCAEAVLRYALQAAREDTGVQRALGDADPMGLTMYQRMGCRIVANYITYKQGKELRLRP